MQVTTYGLDLAKLVFQVHSVDATTGELARHTLKRRQVLQFFANRTPGVVAMEACGSAHHWARQLVKQGHQVRLIAADPWLKALLARRAHNVVVVALANKMARTIWALLAYGRTYQAGFGVAPSAATA
jgi:transposase